ncbi:citrate lyase subunit alpha [Methylobacterium sp. WSM2598]|uniref:citrate lyase subunit alpha n=1 Tax=Methylobacterium sp. WSM2598 TaxID=398261 RepID=UPI00036CDC4D|nr:citrate lyase subunit alpha [Methylobacterium sp. WSM2598]
MSIPSFIAGYGKVRPFRGAFAAPRDSLRAAARIRAQHPGEGKVLPSIREAIRACGLKDGATVSFHHHLRNGDDVLRAVMQEIAALGLRDIQVAASSLFPVHAPLVAHIRSGVVTRLATNYVTGPVAEAIAAGELPNPAVLQTHGGRARAIEAGELPIDVAFVAAPAADVYGNLNGVDGPSACGPLGYPMVDARHAGRVVAITDALSPYPLASIDIAQDLVDYVVPVDSIGDASKIVSGTTRVTEDPVGLSIAATAAKVIDAAGLLVDGFSFQTGAGGISLAVAQDVAAIMRDKGVVGSFAAGGVHQGIVSMFRQGLFRTLFDVQCFDLAAVASYREDRGHVAMSASLYANPASKGALVNHLDCMVMGAAEIDLAFNVNVTAVNGGAIIGGSGGHADTAAGAKLALVTTKLAAGGAPKIVDAVECVTTPGETVDAVVTEAGVAVNPRRADLSERLAAAGLPLVDIARLRDLAADRTKGAPRPQVDPQGRIVALVEYRDGTVTDVVRQRRN